MAAGAVAYALPELEAQTSAATFLFADIAGFTALTEAHGDEMAADLAARFHAEVGAALPEEGATVVKTMGDAVMARVADPRTAVLAGLEIASPTVRVGMHHGHAIERSGDYFGASVNLAARVVALAAPTEVLITGATRQAIGRLPGVELEDRGERRLRNMALPVRIFRVASGKFPIGSGHLPPHTVLA